MAPPADYWDSVDLKALLAGGLVREDVMDKIWDISRIPLPFTERVMEDVATNDYTEWTKDELPAPDVGNAVVSGADAATNNAQGGTRVGNYCQNSVKLVEVTERAQNTDQVGRANEAAYQIMMRQQDLRRDVEAMALLNNASVADDNNTVAGEAGGFDSWIETNIDAAEAGAAVGGFNTGTKIVDAHTDATTAVAGTEARLSALIELAYNNNANPTVMMSTPAVTKRLAKQLLASGLVATPTANVRGDGGKVEQTSQGFLNVMVTDFGFTMEIVPNRLQQDYNTDTAASLLGIDPQFVSIAFLKRYATRPLAKLGLSERSQISVDWTVKVYQEKAHFNYRDIDEDAAWTA